MINYNFGTVRKYLEIIKALEDHTSKLQNLPPMHGPLAKALSSQINHVPDDLKKNILDSVSIANDLFGRLRSKSLQDRISRCKKQVESYIIPIECANELRILRETIEDELQHHHFYHYPPPEKAEVLLRAKNEWRSTLTAFPPARDDIKAAVDCFALGHNHASIYHSMMILERGLPSLAKRLKVPFQKARPTWGDMTTDIRREIDARRTAIGTPPKGSKPLSKRAAKQRLDFLGHCGEAALEFRFFEHAWRNHIAHGRANYDENDAKKVLEHVRAFMELVATRLKLKEES